MNNLIAQITARLRMLGIQCEDLSADSISSPIAALACFPMYMVANVHGWTGEHHVKLPLLDLPSLEAIREAFVIGEEEAALHIAPEHRKVVDSMLSGARPPDRVVYEYAIETLNQYFALAQPAVVERLRTLIAKMMVDVAKAAGASLVGTEVGLQQRACISHIAVALQLADAPEAARVLGHM